MSLKSPGVPRRCVADVGVLLGNSHVSVFRHMYVIISLWDAVGETCMTLVAIICPLVQIGTDKKATDLHFNVIGPLF